MKNEDYSLFMNSVLVLHMIVEKNMETIISISFPRPEKAQKWGYAQKLNLLFIAGILEGWLYSNLLSLNKIRNNFAHDLFYDFRKEKGLYFKNQNDRNIPFPTSEDLDDLIDFMYNNTVPQCEQIIQNILLREQEIRKQKLN